MQGVQVLPLPGEDPGEAEGRGRNGDLRRVRRGDEVSLPVTCPGLADGPEGCNPLAAGSGPHPPLSRPFEVAIILLGGPPGLSGWQPPPQLFEGFGEDLSSDISSSTQIYLV